MSTMQRPPSDSPPVRVRPARSWVSAVVLLAVVCGIAGLMYQNNDPDQAEAVEPVSPGRSDAQRLGRMSSWSILTPEPGDKPSMEEPADIAPLTRLPGAEARRDAGYVRRLRGVTDIVSLWTVSGVDVGDLAAFYNGQAQVAGFTPLPSGSYGMRMAMMRRYSRQTERGTEVLTVRLATADEFEEIKRRYRERQRFREAARRAGWGSPDQPDGPDNTANTASHDDRQRIAATPTQTTTDDPDPTIDAGGRTNLDDDDAFYFKPASPDAIRVFVILRSPLPGQ